MDDALDKPSEYCIRILAQLVADIILREWPAAHARLDQFNAALKEAERANAQ